MLVHETLPTEIQNIIKYEDLSISYLYLFNIQWFLYKRNIWVNTNLNLYKARFIISHEIGHYIHWDCQNLIWVPFWKNLNEKKADNFALEILLPEDKLLEAGETYEWDLTVLEKVFWVEKELIEKRVKKLLNL
jgi:Zn-dependent peptidase ImmA (M78 family)